MTNLPSSSTTSTFSSLSQSSTSTSVSTSTTPSSSPSPTKNQSDKGTIVGGVVGSVVAVGLLGLVAFLWRRHLSDASKGTQDAGVGVNASTNGEVPTMRQSYVQQAYGTQKLYVSTHALFRGLGKHRILLPTYLYYLLCLPQHSCLAFPGTSVAHPFLLRTFVALMLEPSRTRMTLRPSLWCYHHSQEGIARIGVPRRYSSVYYFFVIFLITGSLII